MRPWPVVTKGHSEVESDDEQTNVGLVYDIMQQTPPPVPVAETSFGVGKAA